MSIRITRLLAIMIAVATTCVHGADDAPSGPEIPKAEQIAMQRLLTAESWPRRAVAALRLEGRSDEASAAVLTTMLDDPAWQVRAFAVRSLGRRRVPAGAGWFDDEQDPRVLRCALRHRYVVDVERLGRGIRHLAKSRNADERLLAAELAAATGDETLAAEAREIIRTIVLRMSRAESGALSPRLAVLTGAGDLRKRQRWRRWVMRYGRDFELHAGISIPAAGSASPSLITQLDADRFAALEEYLGGLGTRDIDLVVCLDCTASMSGELAAAQGGIDDLVLFINDVARSLRFGLVAYRDRRDEFETKGWDLTDDLAATRRGLWSLSAEGGGDSREAVYPALKAAYTKLSWERDHARVLVLVGDAPPHVGFGAKSVELARQGAERGFVTHAIETEGKPVDHFAQIADAGAGRCVSLADDDQLVPEITGLTLGDTFGAEFQELFSISLELCR
ncbi:MAG: hypothetical protein GY715_11540 [Planctomycetes bacterium]|nr:hypothetical protein [Planctomycetota bacterium]